MCGIAGILRTGTTAVALDKSIAAMVGTLRHRGPDALGSWVDGEAGIALGHTRLSVIDVSAAARQPMISSCRRYVLSFNGEIYNFAQLRTRLTGLGRVFTSRSDTEVLLEAIAQWGIERTLAAVDGMFAFAVWDRQERQLSLARDRFGEKPLYYGWFGSQFLFASELKAVRAVPQVKPEICRDALAAYLRFNYVPDPQCIYAGFRKLAPGTWITLGTESSAKLPVVNEYWSLFAVAAASREAPTKLDEHGAVDRLDQLLRQAVQSRAIADVPLGAFLSGGIDSSLIVALMQAQSATRLRTFSIGFDMHGYDEAPQAKAVAAHLGTAHTEFYVGAAEAMDAIPHMPAVYDEPFADSSQLPMYLLSRLARGQVTVAMSGDAGDELFAGYLRYVLLQAVWRRIEPLPVALRSLAARAILALRPRTWDRLLTPLAPLLGPRYRYSTPGDKLHKLARLLEAVDPIEMYLRLIAVWEQPSKLMPGASDTGVDYGLLLARAAGFDSVAKVMLMDATHYLPGDILTKIDRAAMAAGLETRIPFLHPAVVEFTWQLPLSLKLRGGEGKWIVRRLLERYLPRELIERPKQGFAVPLDSWMRGPLREWCEDLLNEQSLRAGGYLDPLPVRAAWGTHLAGRQNLHHPLWGILMFEAWRDAWG